MRNNRVGAIVLDYFGAEKTQKCLLSLIGQSLETVYVLDNSGSEDGTAKLREAVDHVAAANPDFAIEILNSSKNLGFGRGVNYVLSYDRQCASPHDYYLLLNNDAVAGPGLITNMIAEFLKDPSVALVAPRIVSDDPGREFGIWYHRYFGLLLSRPGRGRFHYFTGCCLLFRRDLVAGGGIFDESFFMYGEDVELGWRLTRQGKKMVCATGVFVQHDLGPSVDRTSVFYEYHMARGHFLLGFETCFHAAEIPFLLVAKTLALTCRAIIRSTRYKTLAPIAGLSMSWMSSAIRWPSLNPKKTGCAA